MIKDAAITLFLENGEEVHFELSPTQLKAVSVILGIENVTGNSYNCFSDNTVNDLITRFEARFVEVKEDIEN